MMEIPKIPCFWMETGICKVEICPLLDCEDFADSRTPRGDEMHEIYKLYLREAINPVHDRMKRLFKFKEK